MEEFLDSFYDTENYGLINQNLWLRRRQYPNGVSEWSLKFTTEINGISCKVQEWKSETEIRYILTDCLKSQPEGQKSLIEDFHLNLVEFFPTTRIILEKTESFKFYVDCSGEAYSETWFLIGGIKFHDLNDIRHLFSFREHDWRPNVRSKIVQMIYWINPELYNRLVKEGSIPSALFTEDHIRSDNNPIFALPI